MNNKPIPEITGNDVPETTNLSCPFEYSEVTNNDVMSAAWQSSRSSKY